MSHVVFVLASSEINFLVIPENFILKYYEVNLRLCVIETKTRTLFISVILSYRESLLKLKFCSRKSSKTESLYLQKSLQRLKNGSKKSTKTKNLFKKLCKNWKFVLESLQTQPFGLKMSTKLKMCTKKSTKIEDLYKNVYKDRKKICKKKSTKTKNLYKKVYKHLLKNIYKNSHQASSRKF